jgi:FlaA1/EpsC-like NDP-sugar epimerase
MGPRDFWKGKRIAVTGGVGSMGLEIVKLLDTMDVGSIRVIDNNESGLFAAEQAWQGSASTSFYHCDICDEAELSRVLSNIDLCFHAAALKHVPSCEKSPFSAVNINVLGTQAVIRAALANNLERVLFTSSDKAVNPTNVMGTSKLMGERLFTASNFMRGGTDRRTLFASTRFGNVAGSSGSVIPLFCEQIARGGPLTLTDRRMTRYIMTKADAARLVVDGMALLRGGEVFITKMPVLAIRDLAQVMIEQLAPLHGYDPADIQIFETGSRPGEKLWEELSTDEESRRLLEADRYLVVLPAIAAPEVRDSYIYPGMPTRRITRVYQSSLEAPMERDEIVAILRRPGVLPEFYAEQLGLAAPLAA